jgi:hypothetical protein
LRVIETRTGWTTGNEAEREAKEMAQTTRSTTKRRRTTTSRAGSTKRSNSSSRGTSRAQGSRSRNGTSRGRASSSRGNATRAARSRTSTRKTSNGPVGKAGDKVAELASKAKPPADSVRKTGQRAGRRVSTIASKAKTPLVAGGAALAGIAGGIALKSRTESKRTTKGFRSVHLPKSFKSIDLEQLIDAGRTVRSIGVQVGDVADTAERTRKKHK